MRAREFIRIDESAGQTEFIYHGNEGGIDTNRLQTPMWFTSSKEDAIYYTKGDGFLVVAKPNFKKTYEVTSSGELNNIDWQRLVKQGYDSVRHNIDWIVLDPNSIQVVDKISIDEESLDVVSETRVKKNKWSLIISDQDKSQWGQELIDLVNRAYEHTSLGSFVKDMYAVKGSEWAALDWDQDPDIDCTIFFRKNRPSETWTGYKVQGIGHDGAPESKTKMMNRLVLSLNKPGYWIESSDALSRALAKRGAVPVTDEALCKAIFPNTNLKMLDPSIGLYQREAGGATIQEIIYGRPIVSKQTSVDETKGLPFPGTYEQEYDMFQRKGPRRITAMTNEAFDSSYPYEISIDGTKYIFETEDEVRYKVDFIGKDYVEVMFVAGAPILGGRHWSVELIGTGHARKVFGTIIKIIQDYLQKHKPSRLHFTADKDERSRVNLYKALVSRADVLLPDYVDAGIPSNKASDEVSFMLKRKENINEIADNPYNYVLATRTPTKRVYRFETDEGMMYRVYALNTKENGTNDLEIHFDMAEKNTGRPIIDVTGTGDALRVFGTVGAILQKEVEKQNPEGITFVAKADVPSRVKLYRTIARRLTKMMPEFSLASESTVQSGQGENYLKIMLKRNQTVNEKWSAKYKSSINCNNPKGFSQRAHCQGRKKK